MISFHPDREIFKDDSSLDEHLVVFLSSLKETDLRRICNKIQRDYNPKLGCVKSFRQKPELVSER